MTWPWSRHRREPPTEGRQAREKAEADLRRVREETPQWESLAAELREIRRRNNLAETFLRAAGGRK